MHHGDEIMRHASSTQPVSLTHESAHDLINRLNEQWVVAHKTDGVRMWLACDQGRARLIDRAGRERPCRVEGDHAEWEPLLLDGEWCRGRFVIFDVNVAYGRLCGRLDLETRARVYGEACRALRAVDGTPMEPKAWTPATAFRDLREGCEEGLIFQHVRKPTCYKWKWPRLNTIDLALRGGRFPTAERLGIAVEGAGEEDGIWELAPNGGGFVVVGRREDKTHENADKTILDAVRAAQEEFDIFTDFA